MKKILINQACQHTQTVLNESGRSQIPSLFITHIQIRNDYCGHFADVWHWVRTQETGRSQDHYGLCRVKPRPSSQQTGSHRKGLHLIHEKTSPIIWRHQLLRSFKCCSRDNSMQTCLRLPCKHWRGIQQWLQDFVDMPEPAAHSAEPTTPTQEETGYISLPYNMNCHSYTRSGKRHKYFKCKQQKNLVI